MSDEHMNRRSLLTSLLVISLAPPALAQHTASDGTNHSSGGGGAGGHGGGQYGRPVDRHSDGHDDDHGDDHGDEHTDDEHEDDHGDDHASGSKGKKGKGGPQYRGGRDAVTSVRGGHGRSLEDKVFKRPVN